MMGSALLAVGLIAGHGQWPTLATAPLLLCAGAGHALGFSPMTNRMTSAVRVDQAADLSGLIWTAGLIGQVIGVAALSDIYLSAASHDAGHALTITTAAVAITLGITTLCARRATTEPAGSSCRRPTRRHPPAKMCDEAEAG